MTMYKENLSKEKLDKLKHETVEQALERGVKIEKIPEGKSGLKQNQSSYCPIIDISKLPKEFRDLV